jgi:hypothetical protein
MLSGCAHFTTTQQERFQNAKQRIQKGKRDRFSEAVALKKNPKRRTKISR